MICLFLIFPCSIGKGAIASYSCQLIKKSLKHQLCFWLQKRSQSKIAFFQINKIGPSSRLTTVPWIAEWKKSGYLCPRRYRALQNLWPLAFNYFAKLVLYSPLMMVVIRKKTAKTSNWNSRSLADFFLPKSAEFCPAAFCSLVSLDRIVCLAETSLSLLLSLTSSLLVMLLMPTNCSKHHLCQKWTDPFWISLKPKLIAIKQRLISLSR